MAFVGTTVASDIMYDTNKYYVGTGGGSGTYGYITDYDFDYIVSYSDRTAVSTAGCAGGICGTYTMAYEPRRYVYEPFEINGGLDFGDWVTKVYGEKKNEYEVELI